MTERKTDSPAGQSTVILNSGTVILNKVKNLVRKPGGRESLWCSRSFTDAQDDTEGRVSGCNSTT